MYEQWEKQSRGGGLSPVGIENLKIAIVKQAADDYVDLRGGFAVETADCNVKETLSFLLTVIWIINIGAETVMTSALSVWHN